MTEEQASVLLWAVLLTLGLTTQRFMTQQAGWR